MALIKLTFQQYWHKRCIHKYYYSNEYKTVIEYSHRGVVSELKKHTTNHNTDKCVHK